MVRHVQQRLCGIGYALGERVHIGARSLRTRANIQTLSDGDSRLPVRWMLDRLHSEASMLIGMKLMVALG